MESDRRQYSDYVIFKAGLEDALHRASQQGLTKDTDRIEYKTYPMRFLTMKSLIYIRRTLDDVDMVLNRLRDDISMKCKSDYKMLSKKEKCKLLKIKKNQ